jgi:hypothetical protein
MDYHFFGLKGCLSASFVAILLIAMMAKGINCEAATYYVDSVAGDDTNSGTSPSAAWQTVSKVMNELSGLEPGDAVLFKGGDIWNEQFEYRWGSRKLVEPDRLFQLRQWGSSARRGRQRRSPTS